MKLTLETMRLAIANRERSDNSGVIYVSNEAWESVARRLHLSTTELHIVQAIFDGLTEIAVADQFQVSPHTIHFQVRGLYTRLGVANRVALVLLVVSPFLSNTPNGVA